MFSRAGLCVETNKEQGALPDPGAVNYDETEEGNKCMRAEPADDNKR